MNRTALLAARLRDLQARSEATDHAAERRPMEWCNSGGSAPA
ncbi:MULTISPECIES: hypothetical protein [unclassified Cyanobium]|nr:MULTISPECIES: hypothetical protein [unclassified Cyanobium]